MHKYPLILRLVVLFCIFTAFISRANAESSGMGSVDLNGAWEFRADDCPTSGWMPATVPGCVHTDLMANGRIPDPFPGRNELLVQDVEEHDWVYRKRFTVSAELLARKEILLVCEGLDTAARVFLNRKPLGKADNMFRRWEFPAAGALKAGENELEIIFAAPARWVQSLPEYRLLPKPVSMDPSDCRPFLRKAQYQFGWDWGPRLVTCGVWKPIRLIASDGPRIESVVTRQSHAVNAETGGRTVALQVLVDVASPVEARAVLSASVAGADISKEVVIKPGAGRHELELMVAAPALWWPAGHGAQKLYDLKVSLAPDTGAASKAARRIGFRSLLLETRKDAAGVSFKFIVNGRPIFCKGANWIPADSFPSRVSPEDYRRLLGDAAACNMNMIRVWGGGIYECDLFYDICDELGLLVWQDFMFACSLYPASDVFLANVGEEARQNIRRLANHPCVALWCGNNECRTGLESWYKANPMQWYEYCKLFHELLPGVAREEDPTRPYWPSSPTTLLPESSNLDPRAGGDSHVWNVWHGSKPFETYETIPARFVSEFGFQSFPPLKTILSYADPSSLTLSAPDVEHHQKNNGGNRRILTTLRDRFQMPLDFPRFVVLSQIQQAVAMQIGVEHWRRLMPHCMGTLYWQLNDCWPVASWSSIDYPGRWKALQYFARRFFEPFHLSATGADGVSTVTIHATCDLPAERPEPVRVQWALMTYKGERVASGAEDFLTTTTPASTPVCTLDLKKWLVDWDKRSSVTPYTPYNTYLSYKSDQSGFVSRNVRHFAPFRELKLPRPNLKVRAARSGEGMEVTVSTDVFAKWVWLEAEGEKREGRFSDNFFDLEPGESRTVRYSAPRPERFVAKSLVDTYWEE